MDRIICGDNLFVMQEMPENSIPFCYIDPPFFTQKQYEFIFGDEAERRAFEDRWVKMGEGGKYTKDINVYLAFMEPRLREIYRILKKDGSFYLHCDWHADAYLKILCDQIFGYDNFRADVIWNKGFRGTEKQRNYQRAHDHIFFYTKGDNYVWNDQFQDYKDVDMKRYNKIDEEGRKYALIKRKRTSGEIYYGKCYPKAEGKRINDIIDIPTMASTSSERLGYPTQKPEALLERLILASSNKGDVVLDSFCGCGTTLAVAQRLGRQSIGIDISPTACRLIAKRINMPVKDIERIPLTSDEIAALSGWEFQNYVIHLLTLHGKGISVGKKGADGGLDGHFNNLPISVKKYRAGRKDLDEFVATLYRVKKSEGMFLSLGYSSDFTKEVARLKREQSLIICPFTLTEVLEEKHLEILKKYSESLSRFESSKSEGDDSA